MYNDMRQTEQCLVGNVVSHSRLIPKSTSDPKMASVTILPLESLQRLERQTHTGPHCSSDTWRSCTAKRTHLPVRLHKWLLYSLFTGHLPVSIVNKTVDTVVVPLVVLGISQCPTPGEACGCTGQIPVSNPRRSLWLYWAAPSAHQ